MNIHLSVFPLKNILIPLFLLCLNSVSFAQNREQEKSVACLLKQYDAECVQLEKIPSVIFPQGIQISLRENHTPSCWGGVGDPNTSPVFLTVDIDRFGRMFVEDFAEGSVKPAEQAKVIDNIKQWKHPIKAVFAKHGITLKKVALYAQKTLPYFYVDDHALLGSRSDKKQKELFNQLLKANGQWDLLIVTDGGNVHYLEGKKRKLDSSCPHFLMGK